MSIRRCTRSRPTPELAELKTLAEDIRQRLLRVPDVNKVDIIGERPRKCSSSSVTPSSPRSGITPQQMFDSVRGRTRCLRRIGRDFRRPYQCAGDRRVLGRRSIAAVPVHADGQIFRLGDIATVKRGYEDPPSFTSARTASRRSASASPCRKAPTSSRWAKTSSAR